MITSSEPACLCGDHEQLSSASQFSPIWLLQSGWEILTGERFVRDACTLEGFPEQRAPVCLDMGEEVEHPGEVPMEFLTVGHQELQVPLVLSGPRCVSAGV